MKYTLLNTGSNRLQKSSRLFPKLNRITWNCSESAPDGIGAVVKRTADKAISCMKHIPDLETFCEVIQTEVKKIEIIPLKKNFIEDFDLTSQVKDIPDFKGTMKIHQIIWNRSNQDELTYI